MKRFPKLLIVSILVASTLSASNAQGGPPRVKKSPPGQLTIVTVNAQQFPILGMQRFRAMFQLTIALRRRPKAFDGGFYGAVQAPDVVVLQEIRNYNAEIFERILRQRFRVRYQIISPPDAAATLIVHPETVSLIGDVALITDRCAMAGDDRYPVRRYPLARFVENESDRAFSVVGVHFPKPSQNVAPECLERNIEQLRTVLEAEQTPTIIAGDFNRRPVQERYECDPDESSDPLPWYRDMTASDPATRDYVDTVRQFNRRNSISMEFEWTHEQKSQRTGCDGNPHLSRSRIDYIFAADAAVAEAHADHPGWAGVLPGSSHPKHYKYSDHRWVWARLVLSGPGRPERPSVTPDEDGVMHVSWTPVSGATGYIVYRAIGERASSAVARLSADTSQYDDQSTQHGRSYRYAIAAIGPDNGQGVESRGESGIADARGPRPIAVYPPPGAIGVGPGQALAVRFDEGIARESVTPRSLSLVVDGHIVGGFVVQKFPRLLKFNPDRRLKRGKTYTAVVSYGLEDRLGNESSRFTWRFRTEEPPRRPRRRS